MIYYQTFNPKDRYEQIEFIPDVALQSRELNDLQAQQDYKKLHDVASSHHLNP